MLIGFKGFKAGRGFFESFLPLRKTGRLPSPALPEFPADFTFFGRPCVSRFR